MQTISKNPPSQKMRKRKKHAEEMGALEASRGAGPLCTGSDPGSMRAGRDAEGTARAEIDKLPVELRPLTMPSDDGVQVQMTTLLGPFTPGKVLKMLSLLPTINMARRWRHVLEALRRASGWRVQLLLRGEQRPDEPFVVKGYRTALFVIRGQRCYPSFVLEPQGPRAPHAAEDHVDIVGMTECVPSPACLPLPLGHCLAPRPLPPDPLTSGALRATGSARRTARTPSERASTRACRASTPRTGSPSPTRTRARSPTSNLGSASASASTSWGPSCRRRTTRSTRVPRASWQTWSRRSRTCCRASGLDWTPVRAPIQTSCHLALATLVYSLPFAGAHGCRPH